MNKTIRRIQTPIKPTISLAITYKIRDPVLIMHLCDWLHHSWFHILFLFCDTGRKYRQLNLMTTLQNSKPWRTSLDMMLQLLSENGHTDLWKKCVIITRSLLVQGFLQNKYTQNLILKAPLITKAKAVCTVERPRLKTPMQFISNSWLSSVMCE